MPQRVIEPYSRLYCCSRASAVECFFRTHALLRRILFLDFPTCLEFWWEGGLKKSTRYTIMLCVCVRSCEGGTSLRGTLLAACRCCYVACLSCSFCSVVMLGSAKLPDISASETWCIRTTNVKRVKPRSTTPSQSKHTSNGDHGSRSYYY